VFDSALALHLLSERTNQHFCNAALVLAQKIWLFQHIATGRFGHKTYKEFASYCYCSLSNYFISPDKQNVPSYLGRHTMISRDANSLIVGYQRPLGVHLLGGISLFGYSFTVAP
jgi:hypothetical protein